MKETSSLDADKILKNVSLSTTEYNHHKHECLSTKSESDNDIESNDSFGENSSFVSEGEMCRLYHETIDEIDLMESYDCFEEEDDELLVSDDCFEEEDDELLVSQEEDNTFQVKSMRNEKNSDIELKDSFEEDELLVSEEEDSTSLDKQVKISHNNLVKKFEQEESIQNQKNNDIELNDFSVEDDEIVFYEEDKTSLDKQGKIDHNHLVKQYEQDESIQNEKNYGTELNDFSVEDDEIAFYEEDKTSLDKQGKIGHNHLVKQYEQDESIQNEKNYGTELNDCFVDDDHLVIYKEGSTSKKKQQQISQEYLIKAHDEKDCLNAQNEKNNDIESNDRFEDDDSFVLNENHNTNKNDFFKVGIIPNIRVIEGVKAEKPCTFEMESNTNTMSQYEKDVIDIEASQHNETLPDFFAKHEYPYDRTNSSYIKSHSRSCFKACLMYVLTALGIKQIAQWCWEESNIYPVDDPRSYVANKHTVRFQKISLLIAGLFALSEAIILVSLIPGLFHCPTDCNKLSGLPKKIMSGNSILACHPSDHIPTQYPMPLSDSSSPFAGVSSSSVGNSSPSVGEKGIIIGKKIEETARSLTDPIFRVRLSLNSTNEIATNQTYSCVNSKEEDFGYAGMSIHMFYVFAMITTVMIWFLLRIALFQVTKDKENNNPCGCCSSIERFGEMSKRILAVSCPFALQSIMVVNANLTFYLNENIEGWYQAEVSFVDSVLLFAAMGSFFLLLLLVIMLSFLYIVPMLVTKYYACCNTKLQQNFRSLIYYAVVVLLFFFSFLGIISLLVYIIEVVIGDLSLNSIEWKIAYFFLIPRPPFFKTQPNYSTFNTVFTHSIDILRIGKCVFIALPLLLDVVLGIVYLHGLITCRNNSKGEKKAKAYSFIQWTIFLTLAGGITTFMAIAIYASIKAQ